jgi:hypothetical protein
MKIAYCLKSEATHTHTEGGKDRERERERWLLYSYLIPETSQGKEDNPHY